MEHETNRRHLGDRCPTSVDLIDSQRAGWYVDSHVGSFQIEQRSEIEEVGRFTFMLDRIRQIFSKPKPSLSDEARDFIAKLAASDIWILAVGIRGTPAMPSITDPGAFEVIAAHRIDVSEIGDDDSVFPFNYVRDGRQAFPFFSTEERARYFLGNSGFHADIAFFQPFRMLAGFVATSENEMFELVLDPRSEAERRIGHDERLLLRSLSTPAQPG